MILNMTFMFINLWSCEIFDITDIDDGFFDRKHIFLFGDLLQLPPRKRTISIRENVSIRNSRIFRYHKWIWFVEIVWWRRILY